MNVHGISKALNETLLPDLEARLRGLGEAAEDLTVIITAKWAYPKEGPTATFWVYVYGHDSYKLLAPQFKAVTQELSHLKFKDIDANESATWFIEAQIPDEVVGAAEALVPVVHAHHSSEARAERDRLAAIYKAEGLPQPCRCGSGIGLYGTRSCTPAGCLDGSKEQADG